MGAGKRRLGGLLTHEDPQHVHKVLGMSCLLHFLWRFSGVGASDMRFAPSIATLASVALHALLSVSSLIFKIPTKRIAEGSRIWPEYRLHSIAFALRSLACMVVIWAELKLGAEPKYAANAIIVLVTLAAADAGTWFVGPAGRSSTIRELDAPPVVRFFFSVMQFHATAGCLFGARRFSTQFYYVWIIQFTAFLLTLRRKNLVPHKPLVVLYGVMLSTGFAVSTYDHRGSFLALNILANGAAVGRMGLRINKYALWAGLAVALHFARPHLATAPTALLAAAWLATVAGIVKIGADKIARDQIADAKKAAEAKAQ
ncbi:hypothetical protein M885DRAFT_510802 [Pelagophyceae sp. CCMP2097]|nr:hypothetical protein M885DRAFT_510802 [Pelagophyceae sp. CCMP2097]|mmetsp:Transcript_18398/g.62009  ORF Transcript_18398/g.62009 Transcript_18398/m.62009 type:complete len:314 (-) Transcript_18398:121-1062(-)